MSSSKTIRVPHLGGIDAGYQMHAAHDASKPTLVMLNAYPTSSELFQPQFADQALNQKVNLIAIEPLGHGNTNTSIRHFTYWDTAIMAFQVLDALAIDRVFVLGTSQGGFICTRMALLDPQRVLGIMPLGTSMDFESERTRSLGCWNGPEILGATINEWTSRSITPNFEPSDDYCNNLIDAGFGNALTQEQRDFWFRQMKANYQGDDGRQRARVATINLKERDGLHDRLFDVRCPVLWMHGTKDPVYSVANAEEEIKLFVNSDNAQLRVVEGGQHFLSYSHPKEINEAAIELATKYAR